MMSDVVRTKKVAHEARPCVLMIFLPAEETPATCMEPPDGAYLFYTKAGKENNRLTSVALDCSRICANKGIFPSFPLLLYRLFRHKSYPELFQRLPLTLT